jgi:uroporphyrinogen III methyltransferase/synthase
MADDVRGKVYLVGAGPGDPELITAKGRRCIAEADVLIYDYLAAKALLGHARKDCERIYVGKKGGDHTLSQDGINRLIAEKARGGKIVTRLKGGDPFIFGRGGEEAEILEQAGVAFEIVPGVTSAIAAPAYAGIPLTHRQYTSTVAFITGHEDPTKNESNIDWQALATGIGTLVFLMGIKNLPKIVEQLRTHGRPAHTPVALVRWGTTARQRTVTGTLDTIVRRADEAGLKAPAVVVVGEVVGLRDTLQWFEKRPLLGKRIVVTRARAQASDLVQRLTRLGAECVECPTIEVVPPDSWQALDRALEALDTYQWLVFTSVNGVQCFFDRLFNNGLDTRALGHIKTAAIGPVTARRMRHFGLNTDIMPQNYRAESVVEAFSKQKIQGAKVLLPRAKEARPVLPLELERMGANVDAVTVYKTIQNSEGSQELIEQLHSGRIDMVTFTSSSTARNFKALLPDESSDKLMAPVTIASIGPITAETAEALGLKADIVANEYTIDGLCNAIVDHYSPSTL